jgi:hypothetical protein
MNNLDVLCQDVKMFLINLFFKIHVQMCYGAQIFEGYRPKMTSTLAATIRFLRSRWAKDGWDELMGSMA